MGQPVLKAKLEEAAEELTPAQHVERVFGRKRAAQLVDVTTDALKKWHRPLSKGGCGGLVPQLHQEVFLAEARRRGLDLKPFHLIAAPIR